MAISGLPTALEKKIRRLANSTDGTSLELAEALWEARALPKTQDGGRPAISDLMELTKLSRRAVGYLIATWKRFGSLDIPRDRLVQIGWTKLALIADRSETGDELAALAIAETCVAKDLPARLKGKPAQRGKMHTIMLRLTDRQHETFETILLAHGAKRPKRGHGLMGKEVALVKALGQIWP